jgi:DNA-binding MarR family transcriptional regulator
MARAHEQELLAKLNEEERGQLERILDKLMSA